jgi:hypothetical protein
MLMVKAGLQNVVNENLTLDASRPAVVSLAQPTM